MRSEPGEEREMFQTKGQPVGQLWRKEFQKQKCLRPTGVPVQPCRGLQPRQDEFEVL